jgi:hypothetical protein
MLTIAQGQTRARLSETAVSKVKVALREDKTTIESITVSIEQLDGELPQKIAFNESRDASASASDRVVSPPLDFGSSDQQEIDVAQPGTWILCIDGDEDFRLFTDLASDLQTR